METKRLTTLDNIQSANILKGRLENEGIKCFLTNEHFTSLFPHYFGMLGAGVQIIVAKNDYKKASELLQSWRKLRMRNEDIICPYCHSTNIGFGLGKKKKWFKIFAVILSVTSGMAFNQINNTYYCRDCGTEFNASDLLY